MADLNKVFLIGRLTQDPELRYIPSGSAVSDLRVATSRSWNGKDGERREETLYIDVTVWGRQAENCCQFLKKGRQIHVEGYLKSENWETQTGEKRTKVKIEAERVQFLDRREDGGPPPPAAEADDFAPSPARQAATAGRGRGGYAPSGAPAARSAPPQQSAAAEDEGDDIPF